MMLYRKSLPGVVFLLLFMISCSNSYFSEKNSLILFDLKGWVKSEAFSYFQNRFPLKKAEFEKLAYSLKTDNPVLVLVRFEN